ncbi:MAG TPA: alpha/beta hydrolase [Chitinophagaceae bacterium]|jgi:poly(3-hydroxybutyrate) depolymerase|nr:alpha/beta hydrolase [Chitinophagaceae bacterium]
MKHPYFFACLLFFCSSFSQDLVHQKDIIYGKAPNWKDQMEDLRLDLIYPSKTKKLPLIVYMHGGTFLNGSKKNLTKFCEQIAKKGFVVANLEYRQGFDMSPEKFQSAIAQAAYRAQQDEAAALRWLVHHEANYPIDTSWIFIGGESAGGVTSLELAYATQNELDLIFPSIHSILGAIDRSGNELNDQYRIKGVINQWGGIADTLLISQQEMQTIPVILFHSVNDQVIPYERSSHPEARFQTVCGSLDIAHRFKNNHARYNLYFIKGAKHGYGFSPNYLTDAISDFIENVQKEKCKSNEIENEKGDVNKGIWDY